MGPCNCHQPERKEAALQTWEERKRSPQRSLDGASPRVSQLVAMEERANRAPNVRHTAQLQEMLNPVNETGMSDGLKAGLEGLSGMDLSGVRVHYNSPKPAQLQALAYTQGTDIHVAPGQEQHLPHEGWHVVQQMQGRVQPTTQFAGTAINDDSGLEREADSMGARALQDGGSVQRRLDPSAAPAAGAAQRKVVQRVQPGPIEHAIASCFVAALINTFTVVGSLKNLLSNNPIVGNPNAAELQGLLLRAVNTVDAGNAGNVPRQWVRNIMVSLRRNGIIPNATQTADVNDVIALVVQRLTGDDANPQAGQPNNMPVSTGIVVWDMDQTLPDAAAGVIQQLDGTGTVFPNVVQVNRQVGNPNVAPQTFNLHPAVGGPITYRLRATIYRDGGYEGGHFVSYVDRGGDGQQWWRSDDLGPSVTAVNDIRNTGGMNMLRRGVTHVYERTDAQTVAQAQPPMIAPLLAGAQQQFDQAYQKDLLGEDVGRKRSPVTRRLPDPKRRKTRETGEEEEAPKLRDSGRMGVITWNVAHFSDRDIGQVLASFEKGFKGFSPDSWNEFFDGLLKYFDQIEKALKPYRGKSEMTLRQYDLFKGLQSPDAQVNQSLKVIADVRQALAEFDYRAVAARLAEVADQDWRGEFVAAQKDPAKRPALADKVKGLKDFEKYSESKTPLFRSIQSLKTRKTLLGRVAPAETKELFADLSSNREDFPQLGLVLDLRRALHSVNIATHVNEMFEDNDWLDAMILQEVNDPTLLELMGTSFDVFRGPHLMSGGKNPQNEYYPLLLRKGSQAKVKTYTVDTRGEMTEVADDQEIGWDKSRGDYRPIVVYEIQKGLEEKPVWIGIVHTTPESDQSGGVAEFHRKKIYREIKLGLANLQNLAEEKDIPLIIGGDFYLTSEAVVEDIESSEFADFADEELDDMQQPLAKVRKLRSILQYLLSEVSDEEAEMPRAKEEEIQRERGRTQKIMKDEGVEDAAKILRERVKFLGESLDDEQLLRNFLELTARQQIEQMGLLVAQTVSGTNPKHDPLARWFDIQIADFFLHNEDFQSAAVGILKPGGGMVPVDAEDLRYSRYWQRFSDHFPVGGIFSLEKENLLEHEAFPQSQKAAEKARRFNLKKLAALRLQQKGQSRRLSQALVELIGMRRGGQSELQGLAQEFLASRLLELRAEEFPTDIDEAIAEIQRLEEEDDLLDEDRLFVVSPSDFEPEDED